MAEELNDERSRLLFGRYGSGRIFVAIAQFEKETFRSADVIKVSGASKDDVSRELKRLADPKLGCLERVGRQGTYRRLDNEFWKTIPGLVEAWTQAAD